MLHSPSRGLRYDWPEFNHSHLIMPWAPNYIALQDRQPCSLRGQQRAPAPSFVGLSKRCSYSTTRRLPSCCGTDETENIPCLFGTCDLRRLAISICNLWDDFSKHGLDFLSGNCASLISGNLYMYMLHCPHRYVFSPTTISILSSSFLSPGIDTVKSKSLLDCFRPGDCILSDYK